MNSGLGRVKTLKGTANLLIYASIFLGAVLLIQLFALVPFLAILFRLGGLDRICDRCIGRCKGLENGIPVEPRTRDSDACCLTATVRTLFADSSWAQPCLLNFHRRISAPSCSNPDSL